MRRKKTIYATILVPFVLVLSVFSRSMIVVADTANAPSLIISQLKITSSNGQFITLYNSTDSALDMSKYQLEYFNNFDLAKATSSRLIGLSGMLPAHGYYMVNDSAMLLCYQLTINSVSLGLSSTAGMVEVLAFSQASPGSGASLSVQDHVGWSKTAAVGAQTLPSNTNAFLMRQPVDDSNNPVVASSGAGSWRTVQPDSTNPCKLTTISSSPAPVPTGLSQLLPPTEAPATIVTTLSDEGFDAAPRLPATDIGLMAPQVTEILPNPDGTGNDNIDEYIELYNSNNKAFDLSGFSLQTGLSSLHTYKFPNSTILPPKSFKAFYSEETSLSLSNTASQARLLDPFGNSISAAAQYTSAKDGQAWALAKSKWYWTTSATPGKANVIKSPPAKKSKKKSTKPSNYSQGKSTSNASAKTGSSTTQDYKDEPSTTPVHTWTLVLIGGLGILYAVYEHRTDLGNRVHQLRENFRNRRASRSET